MSYIFARPSVVFNKIAKVTCGRDAVYMIASDGSLIKASITLYTQGITTTDLCKLLGKKIIAPKRIHVLGGKLNSDYIAVSQRNGETFFERDKAEQFFRFGADLLWMFNREAFQDQPFRMLAAASINSEKGGECVFVLARSSSDR